MKRISEPCFARSSTIHHLLLYLCAMEPRLGIPYLFWREILKPICIQSYAWLEFSEQVGFWYISSPSDSSRLFSPHQYMMQESGQTNLICWQNYVPSLYKIDYTSLVCSFFFSFLNKDIHTTGSFRCLNLVDTLENLSTSGFGAYLANARRIAANLAVIFKHRSILHIVRGTNSWDTHTDLVWPKFSNSNSENWWFCGCPTWENIRFINRSLDTQIAFANLIKMEIESETVTLITLNFNSWCRRIA